MDRLLFLYLAEDIETWNCLSLLFYFKGCPDFAQSKIIEYLKLEGTNKDYQDQLPAGLCRTKPYD